MSLLVVALWIIHVTLDTGGQLAIKAAASDRDAGDGLDRWRYMARRPWLWLGIGCYVLEFVVWTAFLSLVPLSEGVLLGSINTVALMVAGKVLFHERLTRLRVAGMLLVSMGVAVVGISA